MNISSRKVKVELNSSEKDLVYAMHNLTNQYIEKTNECEGLSCMNCPLNLFCYQKDTSKEEVIESIINGLERHVNRA